MTSPAQRWIRILTVSLIFACVVGLAGVSAQDRVTLVATGSSLPEPLYLAWGDEYHKINPQVVVRYLPQGTGESGIDIVSGSGDLGGGDAPSRTSS